MKTLYVFIGIIGGLLLLIAGFSLMKAHANKPGVLIARLRDCSTGEKEEVMTQIQLARGDFTTPVIEEFGNMENPAIFRAELIKLLYQINLRSTEPRIPEILNNSLTDPQAEVRNAAAGCLAIYGKSKDHLKAIDLLADPDPMVRRQAYLILNADGRRAKGELWSLMSEEQKAVMLAQAFKEIKEGTSKELRFLAESIIGREIAILCNESTEALQTSNLVGAEELLAQAIKLDPDSHRAKSSQVRHFLAMGDKEKALSLAEEYGILMKIPLLAEAPVIDGDPTDEVWAEAFKAETPYLMTSLWVTLPAKGKSEISIGHFEGTIYIAVIAYEDDLSKLVVKNTTRDSQVYMDDCVEFSFDPDNAEHSDYRFSINPAGALFDRQGWDRRKNFKCEYTSAVYNDRGYWACEFAIAAQDMDDRVITNESIWGMNVMRTRISVSEKSAIKPTFGTGTVSAFPLAIFEDAPPPSDLPMVIQDESTPDESGVSTTPQARPNRPGGGMRNSTAPGMIARPRGGGNRNR